MGLLAVVEREVVLLEVGWDEELQRTLTERRVVAEHRGRDDAPAERLGEHIRGDLALVQATREVPQGTLAPHRLVHRLGLVTVVAELGEVGRVRAPGHAPHQRHLAFGEEGQGIGRGPARGHCGQCSP